MERLQKYMATCGVASRRASEKLIAEGKVKVNGTVITEMGYLVAKNDVVEVNGKTIYKEVEKKYYVINKPRSVLSTVDDPKGRKTVISILPEELKKFRLFPVGRLDYDTKGLLLLTNDGDFMNAVVGPKSNTEKEYLVRVKGIVKKEDIAKLSRGVNIGDYTTRPCFAYIKDVDRKNQSTLVGLVISEGKYHQVKRMIEAIGYTPVRLTRIRFGCIELNKLAEGEVRELSIHEVKTLLVQSKDEKEYTIKKARRV